MGGGAAQAQHACAVLVSGEHQAEVASRFVVAEVAAGRRVTFLGLDAEGSGLVRRLAEDGTDARAALGSGQLELLPADESTALLALPDELFGRWLAAAAAACLQDGSTGFSVVTGSLVPRGDAHEVSLDAAARACGARVLCLYARALLDARAVTGVRALHDAQLEGHALHDDGMLRMTEIAPGVLRLAGELDPGDRPAVAAVLDRAARGAGRLELDLASLRFLDAGGAGVLVRLATGLADGLRVRRAGLPVRQVLDLVDLDGVVVDADLADQEGPR